MPPQVARSRKKLRYVSANEFAKLGSSIIGGKKIGTKIHQKRFKAAFGIPPRLVAILWKELAGAGNLDCLGPRSVRPIHLLWSLLFLKCYNREGINSSMVECDEKTFRKWTWFYSKCIADLDKKFVSAFRGVSGVSC